jgi:hypothetical protein
LGARCATGGVIPHPSGLLGREMCHGWRDTAPKRPAWARDVPRAGRSVTPFRIGRLTVHLCGCMSTSVQADQLRARATHLRAISTKIGACRALTVHNLAGPDTWVGPTPQLCHDALLALSRQLQAHERALTDTARTFDRRADELERQQAIQKEGVAVGTVGLRPGPA